MYHSKRRLRVALVSDSLTRTCLEREFCHTVTVTPWNYWPIFRIFRPHVLFVESAWQGWLNSWKFKIASYPDHPKRNNEPLLRMLESAQKCQIPTVFWNKEDGIHFDRFIGSARHFDHILTVDSDCLGRYHAIMGPDASVHTFPFAIQPAVHNFTEFQFRDGRANFVGSYSHHIHDRRREWQDMLLGSASRHLGLVIIDRNSGRSSEQYRFPKFPNTTILPAIPHHLTANIYRQHNVSLNINTIENSPTMFSRRLIEIIACGGIAATNPSLAVSELFYDYCHIIHNRDEADELFARLRHGPNKSDLERARAGAAHIHSHFTWAQRLDQLSTIIGLK